MLRSDARCLPPRDIVGRESLELVHRRAACVCVLELRTPHMYWHDGGESQMGEHAR